MVNRIANPLSKFIRDCKSRTAGETVLIKLNNTALLNKLKTESLLHEKREYDMLKNIYKYSQQYPYQKAILICGVAHRQSLRQKIKECEISEALKLNWKFYNEQ